MSGSVREPLEAASGFVTLVSINVPLVSDGNAHTNGLSHDSHLCDAYAYFATVASMFTSSYPQLVCHAGGVES